MQLELFHKDKKKRLNLLLKYLQKRGLTKYQAQIFMLSCLGYSSPKIAQLLKRSSAGGIRSLKSSMKKQKLGGKPLPYFTLNCLMDFLEKELDHS